MRGYFENDFFGGHFWPQFKMGGPLVCPFPGEFPAYRGSGQGFGPGTFCPRVEHSSERQEHHQHGTEHHRRGPPEDGSREHRCRHHESESDNDGPTDRHWHGPPGFRRRGGMRPGSREYDPSCCGPRPCFGRRGPSEFPHRPWRGPWEGLWGPDRHMHRLGRSETGHPPGHKRSCAYNSEERPTKNTDSINCRETQPCCSGDKKKRRCARERMENGPNADKDKDENVGDTVFVQRIVLEKATRPQSV